MKQFVTGILAHVDAGKTTLSESLLYITGSIRKMGKVDTKDAFLDTNDMERARGITIFSKQARFNWKDTDITIVDTPGHVDFSAEMERVLQILDYAILVVSGADGVQGHTRTLWHLLEKYEIPVFIFVNKMDQSTSDAGKVLGELKKRLDAGCVDFTDPTSSDFMEEVASTEEAAMEEFFETDHVSMDHIRKLIAARKVFPCYFGSALKNRGVEEFLNGFTDLMEPVEYPETFGAKIFKISRDEQGNRLTHMKITGGSLKVKTVLSGAGVEDDENWNEKINQIRLYSGDKFEAPTEVAAGTVCAVTGLTKSWPGQGLGMEPKSFAPILEPVLSRSIILPEGMDVGVMLPKLMMIAEEQPELHIVWDEHLREIQAQVMGEVQIEILKTWIQSRFGVEISFGPSHIVYKETIREAVEGVGHFEPLRHYAEAHVMIEPLPEGSGIQYAYDCSEDLLDKNWQRLIMQHLQERTYRGVLTGSALTDVRFTVVGGRAHPKHTEGGDFRQATYRAVRMGLMMTESVLLEPYYDFRLELPEGYVGRAMTDIEKMNGHFDAPEIEGDITVLTGHAPVVSMQNYQQEVIAYTKGFGRLFFSLRGYGACHNTEEVLERIGYDPEADVRNPADSVFCAHGSGFIVPWYDVPDYMHVESAFYGVRKTQDEELTEGFSTSVEEQWIGVDEVDAILERTYNANKRDKSTPRRGMVRRFTKNEYIAPVTRSFRAEQPKEEYLLVDGYNIIYAWDDLNEMARENMDSARGILLDRLCDYQGYRKMNLIAVFDAYRVKGHTTEVFDYHNIHVVFTKEAETADQYIEKFAHSNAGKYRVTVATSDGLEQIIIRGEGARLLSAKDLRDEMELAKKSVREQYMDQPVVEKKATLGEVIEKVLEKQ